MPKNVSHVPGHWRRLALLLGWVAIHPDETIIFFHFLPKVLLYAAYSLLK